MQVVVVDKAIHLATRIRLAGILLAMEFIDLAGFLAGNHQTHNILAVELREVKDTFAADLLAIVVDANPDLVGIVLFELHSGWR